MTEIQDGPPGGSTIDVTFEINAGGILTVSARNQATGTTNALKIGNVIGRLNQEQVDKVIRDAKISLQDVERKNAQARDALEAECNGIQNMVCEHLDDIHS